MPRYDRYDRWRDTPSFAGWYPGAFWAGAPMYGWDGTPGWPPYPGGYDRHYAPRRDPYDSPFYGRGGDRGAREWARGHGYDAGYAVPPRRYLGPVDRMRYDQQHYDPRGARRYDDRYHRTWDRWW